MHVLGTTPRLGKLEWTVMEQLWGYASELPGGATVRDVLVRLESHRQLAYTTVMTVLERLNRKGLVTRVRDGRVWRYSPSETRETAMARLLRQAIDEFVPGDRRAAVHTILLQATDEELADVEAALEDVLTERRRGGAGD